MSIPYTSEDFTTPRAGGDSWVEYPFIEYGDNSSKVYHMRCTVNKDDYTAIALDTTMASASNASVLVLPFAADTSAYFVGDFNHRVKDGALIEFDRQFSTIPATRTEHEGSLVFEYPGYESVNTGTGFSALELLRGKFSEISKLKTTYNYQLGTNFTLDSIFSISIGNYRYDNFNVRDGSSSEFPATSPTLSAYQNLNELVYSSEIIKYKGNIHAKKTVYVERK
jgi:hypothetical protein